MIRSARSCRPAISKKFPDTKYLFTAGSAATGMYRGIKFYEAAVKETERRSLRARRWRPQWITGKLDKGPGGGAEMVPGKMHCKMNMYIAVSARSTPTRPATR